MERWDDQKRQQDLDDLNNESAGRDVGRISHFHHDRDPQQIEARKREEKHRHDMLLQMLRDAEYAAAYQNAWVALDNAQSALTQALLENAEEAERLAEVLDATTDQAAHLPDGTMVFRAADGSLRDADGNRLRSDALPASLAIPEDAPSYEEYVDARNALYSARVRGQELARIQTDVIDPARNRLNDRDNPPDADELDRIRDQMDSVAERIAADGTAAVFADQEPPETEPVGTEASDVPLFDLPTLR